MYLYHILVCSFVTRSHVQRAYIGELILLQLVVYCDVYSAHVGLTLPLLGLLTHGLKH